jgi:CRISPR/Cas system-associated exonuclease Cas4 (RecB family)
MLKDLKGSDENRDGVRIMPFELAAGIKTKALFFGGVIEGDLPSMPDIDPILPERVKKGLGLPYLDHYLDRQKRYFTRLLNAPLIDTFFSCPSADGDKVFLPSPFLDWEKSISPADLKIYSEQEVLIREGAIKHTVSKAGIFDGKKISHGKKAPGMLRQRIKAMSKGFINVTDIDYYRRCPLRFYVERVLCLEIITPPKFEVEARLWGNLAHRIMEHLFKNGDIDLDKLDEKVFQGLEKSLKQFPIENFWAEVAKEIFQRLLPLLKKQENDIRIQGYRPFKTETKLTAEINGLKLKGKVDRVDRGIQSTDKDAHGTVNLIDYKTGNIDSKSLQLPLYAAIWRKNFSEAVKGLGYYSLKDGRINWYPGKITMGEFVGNALQHAEDLVMNMKSGMFPPEPYKAAECRYCYHSPLCNSSNQG